MARKKLNDAREFGRMMQPILDLRSGDGNITGTDVVFVMDTDEIQADAQPKQATLSGVASVVSQYISAGGTPGGSNTQVQFNNNGAFGGDADLTFNTATNTLETRTVVAQTVEATLSVVAEQVEPPNGQSLELAIFGGSTSTNGATAGTVYLVGGEFANPNAGVTGTGGDVFIRGGDGPGLNSVVNGGDVTIRGGDPQNGGTPGSVSISDIGQLLIETTSANTAPRFQVFPTTASSSVTLRIDCVDNSSLATFLINGNGGINHWSIDSNGDIWPKQGLATMEDGFLYIPSANNPPTGVPTSRPGAVALYYDSLNKEFCIYDGGWRTVATTAPA